MKRNSEDCLYVFCDSNLSLLYFSDQQGSDNKYKQLVNEVREDIESMADTITVYEILEDEKNQSDSEEEIK